MSKPENNQDKIGVCSNCGELRVKGAPCYHCDDENAVWEMM